MLATLLFLGITSQPHQGPLLEALDRLVRAKDVAGLSGYLESPLPPQDAKNPFFALTAGGAYAVGKFGWHALSLKEPQGSRQFVVFTTALTSEDVGELVFEIKNEKLTFIPEDDLLGVKIKHHDFDISFNTPKKYVEIHDQVTLTSDSAGMKLLRFGPPYRVDSINKKKEFVQSGGTVALQLPAGKQTLDIRYHATVDLPGYAAGISQNEFTLTNDYWYPMVGRWPASYDMTVHAPVGWAVAGQGILVSKKKEDRDVAWHYHMGLPVSYYSVTAAPFKPVVQRIHGRPYTVWSSFIPRKRALLQGPIYSGIVEFYNSAFGPWPFPGYGCVVSKSYGGGALEAYSYATYGDNDIPGEDAHEPSHTFWGGVIPNTYLHSMWNESFANFSVGLYERNAPFGSVADRRMAFVTHPQVNGDFNKFAVSQASAFDGPAAGTLGYGKGAQVLAMLEDEIGTPAMLRALKYWVKNHPSGTPGEWEEFEAAVNTVTGKDYGWFFQEWLDRPGYAQFTLDHARFESGAVKLDLTFQSQPYRMTGEVLLGYADGKQDIRRVTIPSETTSTLSISTARKPQWVSFDPYRRLMRPIARDEQPFTIQAARQSMTDVGATETADLQGKIVRGMPGQGGPIKKLSTMLGLVFHGSKLIYAGKTYDLKHGQLTALVPVGDGHYCLLQLGTSKMRPKTGDADFAITDDYGRLVRGHTPPKTKGQFVFPIN